MVNHLRDERARTPFSCCQVPSTLSSTVRFSSATCSHTIRFTVPVSSSSVTNTTPLAVRDDAAGSNLLLVLRSSPQVFCSLDAPLDELLADQRHRVLAEAESHRCVVVENVCALLRYGELDGIFKCPSLAEHLRGTRVDAFRRPDRVGPVASKGRSASAAAVQVNRVRSVKWGDWTLTVIRQEAMDWAIRERRAQR